MVRATDGMVVTSRPVVESPGSILDTLRECIGCRYSDPRKNLTVLKDKTLYSCFVTYLDPKWMLYETDKEHIIRSKPCETVTSEHDLLRLRKRAGNNIADMCKEYYIFWLNLYQDPPPLPDVPFQSPTVCSYSGKPPHVGLIDPILVTPPNVKNEGHLWNINMTFDDNGIKTTRKEYTTTETDRPIVPGSGFNIPHKPLTDNGEGVFQPTPSSSGNDGNSEQGSISDNNIPIPPSFIPAHDSKPNEDPFVDSSVLKNGRNTATMGPFNSGFESPPLMPMDITVPIHPTDDIAPPLMPLEALRTKWWFDLLGISRPTRSPNISPFYKDAEQLANSGALANTHNFESPPPPQFEEGNNESSDNNGVDYPGPYPIPMVPLYPIPDMGPMNTPGFPFEARIDNDPLPVDNFKGTLAPPTPDMRTPPLPKGLNQS